MTSHNEHQKRVLRARKDHGVDVYQVGSVEQRDGEWHINHWDVQGVTRERALEIIREALR